MKVFLTGATGYVGSVVAEKLLEKNHEVVGLVRNEASEAKLIERGITPLRGDLTDLESLKRGAEQADGVIHTAFGHDFANFDKMVQTERNAVNAIAEALAGSGKPFIATNGTAFLGDTGEAVVDENFPAQNGIFGYERFEAEQEFLQTAARSIRSVMLRLSFYVYGRGGSVFLPALIPAAKQNGAAYYVGDGEQKVSAVHVEDAADFYVLALENENARGVYHVATENVSNKQLAEAIARLVSVKAESVSPEIAQDKFGALIGFLIINNQLSAEKAKRELGWQPKAQHRILDDIENGSYKSLA